MKMENQISKIKPADRLASVSEYYFSKKLKEVARMNAEGKDVISLGIGSPDMPPSENTIQTLCNAARNPDGHGYQPYVGIPELRRSFAGWYRKWYGVELDPNTEIQPLIGSKEGILHVTLAFVNPGEQVLVPNPGYPTYTSLSKILGAEVINYNLKEEKRLDARLRRTGEDGHEPRQTDVDQLSQHAHRSKRNAGTLPETGGLCTPQGHCHRQRQPVQLHPERTPPQHPQCAGRKGMLHRVQLHEQSHNMPGWRIGMLASNADFVQWILKVKSNIDSGMFRAMQLAAATALEAGEEWYEGNNRNYRGRRRLAGEIMHELGCTYDENQVGMFLWGKIPDSCADVEELTERVLHEARVFITPGFIFGSNGRRYIRISLCCKDGKLAEALKRVKEMK